MSDEAIRVDEETKDAPVRMGVFGDHPKRRQFSAADFIALILSLVWLAASLAFFFLVGIGEAQDPLTMLVTFMAVAMPIAMFWLGASAAKSARIIREESARIQNTIDAMRHSYIEHQQEQTSAGLNPALEKRLSEIADLAKSAREAALASSPQPDPEPGVEPAQSEPAQTELALEPVAPASSGLMTMADFIQAMNFPEDADDSVGFRAMRAALADHRTAGLVRAAQDLLTLLSEDGIYMDDLHPDRTRPELWRRFAEGERGAALSGLAAVRDRSCLSLTAARMRQDTVFRDTAHHFINRFDKVLELFVPAASDEDLVKLSDTRTARAFMLLSRVSGTFD